MRFAALIGALLLGGCASATLDSNEPRQERELSAKEKSSLRAALARSKFLISPDEAQFKWMPVRYVAGSSETDYCALVSEKNMFGGNAPFHVFHAVLKQTGGEYLTGSIGRMLESGAAPGNAMIAENINNGLVEGYCKKAGYIDFSKAR